MPLVLEPGANVRVREEAEIVTTQLQLGIWLCLRKMWVEEPGPHRSGHAWCLSQGDDNVFLPQPVRGHARTTFIQKGIQDFATLHTWCVDAQFKSRWQSKELFLSLISEYKCVCIPSRSEFLDILLRLDQRLGLGIQFWCGTKGLLGSPPEIITKNNDQSITTYASYPFSRAIAECGRGLAQDLLEVRTVWFELWRVLGWYCFGYLLGSMYLGLELNQTGTNRQTNKKQNKTKPNKPKPNKTKQTKPNKQTKPTKQTNKQTNQTNKTNKTNKQTNKTNKQTNKQVNAALKHK